MDCDIQDLSPGYLLMFKKEIHGNGPNSLSEHGQLYLEVASLHANGKS